MIAANLHYLHRTYGGGSALAMLPGKRMLVFVYNADDLDTAHGCATVTRWKQAKHLLRQQYAETIYVDLKVFPGYATCAGDASVDGWHQYGPASAVQDFSKAPGDGSYAISPGFWKAGMAYGTAPFLARDRARWQSNIAAMNASGAKWQLITTYNEWGEGTAIESSSGCRSRRRRVRTATGAWAAPLPNRSPTCTTHHPPNRTRAAIVPHPHVPEVDARRSQRRPPTSNSNMTTAIVGASCIAAPISAGR